MWTFTKRGKFEDLDAVWRAWRLFCQSMRRRFKKSFAYVAVPELHSDGERWHIHVLFNRFYMVETLRLYWYRALGGTGSEQGDQTPGSINVKRIRARNRDARGASSYIAAYLGKGFSLDGIHRRVFAASLGLAPISVTRGHGLIDLSLTAFARMVRQHLSESSGVQGLTWRFHWGDGFSAAVADSTLERTAAPGAFD